MWACALSHVPKSDPSELPEKGRRGGRNGPPNFPRKFQIAPPIGKRAFQRWKTVAKLVDEL